MIGLRTPQAVVASKSFKTPQPPSRTPGLASHVTGRNNLSPTKLQMQSVDNKENSTVASENAGATFQVIPHAGRMGVSIDDMGKPDTPTE